MTKAKVKSILLTTIFWLLLIAITKLVVRGIITFLPVPEKYVEYDYGQWNAIHFLIVLLAACLLKVKVPTCKVKNFLTGVFKYGILLFSFCVVYIVVSLIWLNKWGWIYWQGSARVREYLMRMVGACSMIGIAEEFMFRGFILNSLFKAFSKDNRKERMIACFYCSLLFGLWHLSDYIAGVTTSIPYATIITGFLVGFFLAAVYLRTNNIFTVMLLHGLIDYAIICSSLTEGTPNSYYINDKRRLVQIILVAILFIQGFIMLWKDKQEPTTKAEENQLQDRIEA